MLSDYDILLSSILSNPADLLSRRAYADWHEEHGDPLRAEFIRLQLEDRVTSLSREDVLLRASNNRWFPTELAGVASGWFVGIRDTCLATVSGVLGVCLLWKDGFIYSVRCPLSFWLFYGKGLVSINPVESVSVSDKKPRRFVSLVGRDRMEWRFDHGGIYYYSDEHPYGSPSSLLPGELSNCFLDGERDSNIQGKCCVVKYKGSEEAMDALSRACLYWADSTRYG